MRTNRVVIILKSLTQLINEGHLSAAQKLEYNNIICEVPLEGQRIAQSFYLNYPGGPILIYDYMMIRWLPEDEALKEFPEALI